MDSRGLSDLAMEGCRYSDRSHYANNRKVPSLEFPHLHLCHRLLRQNKPQLIGGGKGGEKKKTATKEKHTNIRLLELIRRVWCSETYLCL